ncbi:MAG TPA: DUF1778 domain-containing protein, partial [Candidatus Aquilonibacter sp.]|nr:DUF1778 domain-containing protein [Candidatus Aquilonibacter sp.]
MAPAGGQKEARIEVRTTREQKAFITRGADANGQNVSDFILSSAQEKAEMILADQKEFVLPPDRWAAFVAALDRPATKHERLARLMSEPSAFER